MLEAPRKQTISELPSAAAAVVPPKVVELTESDSSESESTEPPEPLKDGPATPKALPASSPAPQPVTKKIITPKAVVGSQNPSVPTPEMVELFEPQLRAKEGFERRPDVKIACVLFVAYHFAIVACCLRDSGSATALAWKLATFVGAIYYTDLFTGGLHIYLDHRRCDLGDPLDMAAYSFRYDHHAYPNNFFKFSAIFPSGAANILMSITGPFTLAFHALLWYFGGLYHTVPTDSALELKLIFLFTFIAGGSICQTTHALAHEGRTGQNKTFPRLIATLQRCHLILPPKAHAGHHQFEHDVNFCILNGWANPLLNRLTPSLFWAMRQAPGHFDALAVPGPNSWASQQKAKRSD